MESRDRAVELDSDVAEVARFMERNVAADRLHYVACRLPELAALIWSEDRCAGLYVEPAHAATRADSLATCRTLKTKDL